MYQLIQALRPYFVLPFAGVYVLGGFLHEKNEYLGSTTWEECGKYLKNLGLNEDQLVLLREKDVFDFKMGKSNEKYIPIDNLITNNYVELELSRIIYPFQLNKIPDKNNLIKNIEKASNMMKKGQKILIWNHLIRFT